MERHRLASALLGLWLACGPAAAQSPAGAAAGPDMDMQSAVAAAVQSHPSISAAIAALAQNAGAVDVARAGYRPQVRAGIEAGRQVPDRNGKQLTISASQMLYDFGKVDSAVAQSEAGVRQQQAELLLKVDQVAHDTAQALIEVHRFQQLEGLNQALVAALQDIVRLTELRAAAGATSQADPISAKARLGAAQAGLLSVRSQLGQQRSKLSLLTGLPPPENVRAPVTATLQRWSRPPYPELATLPAVLSAQAELEASQAGLAKAKAQQRPTLSLEATANKPIGAAPPGFGSDHSVMLSLSGALYQGGALAAQAKAAAFGVDAARARIASTRLEWEQRQRQLAQQADGLQERLSLLASRQEALQASRPLYREQYLALGTRSVLDLLNNEQEIFQATADQANAEHDLWISQLDILHATGQMRQAFNLTQAQTLDLTP